MKIETQEERIDNLRRFLHERRLDYKKSKYNPEFSIKADLPSVAILLIEYIQDRYKNDNDADKEVEFYNYLSRRGLADYLTIDQRKVVSKLLEV